MSRLLTEGYNDQRSLLVNQAQKMPNLGFTSSSSKLHAAESTIFHSTSTYRWLNQK